MTTVNNGNDLFADIVLEGGGVKGIGLVGALTILLEQGYRFRRVAGTSAGAIVGSLLAAGMTPEKMEEVLQSVDYTKFQDETLLSHLLLPGKIGSLLLHKGIYRGRYAQDWLAEQLELLGVRTFADLRLTEEWASTLPKERAYKLVVIVSDISTGRLIRLPWDYPKYGLDPDKQPVAEAVRASMAIPFFFTPTKLEKHFMVDGGILSNFPITIFDQEDKTPRWPTLGIKLSAKPEANLVITNKVEGTLSFAQAIFGTMASAHDQIHLDDPSVVARTTFIDTGNVKTTNFQLRPEQREFLFASGKAAMEKFLSNWDFQSYIKKYRP